MATRANVFEPEAIRDRLRRCVGGETHVDPRRLARAGAIELVCMASECLPTSGQVIGLACTAGRVIAA